MTARSPAYFSFKDRVLPKFWRQERKSERYVKIVYRFYHFNDIIIFLYHRIRQVRHDCGIIWKYYVDQRFPTLRPQVTCKDDDRLRKTFALSIDENHFT